ncbi:MAG: hypothetical protein AB7G93_12455 [Bdellovibrionales bacterium]
MNPWRSELAVIAAILVALSAGVACSNGAGGKIPINRNIGKEDSAANSRSEALSKAASESPECFRLDRVAAALAQPANVLYTVYTADMDLGEISGLATGTTPSSTASTETAPPFKSTADLLTRGLVFLKGDWKPGLEALTAQDLKTSQQVAHLLQLDAAGQKGCETITFAAAAGQQGAREFRILNRTATTTSERETPSPPTPAQGTTKDPKDKRPTPTKTNPRSQVRHSVLALESTGGPREFRWYALIRGRNQLLITVLRSTQGLNVCGTTATNYWLKETYAVDWGSTDGKVSLRRTFAELLATYIQEPAELEELLTGKSEGAEPTSKGKSKRRASSGNQVQLSFPGYAYILDQVHKGKFQNLDCPAPK